MNKEYLNLLKSTLNNYLYLGTDNAACDKSFYENGKWKIPRRCVPHTLCNSNQLDFLHDIMVNTINNKIEGDYLEVGVWRGGASIFMRAILKVYKVDSKVFLSDTFSGIPISSSKYSYTNDMVDFWSDRWESSLTEVKNHFKRYNLLDNKVCFLKGDATNSLKSPPYKNLALARLDVDSYESYMSTLINVYPKMSKGGCIIFDDWHLISCKDAISDFRNRNNITQKVRETFKGKKVDAHWIIP